MVISSSRRRLIGTAASIAAVAGTMAALPPSTQSCLFRSGTTVNGMGAINSPFNPSSAGAVGTESFGPVSINGSGYSLAVANIFAAEPLSACILTNTLGLAPWIGAGFLPPDSPALGLPDPNYAARTFHTIDANNSGLVALGLRVGQGDFGPAVSPFAGVAQGKQAFVVRDGSAVTAAGVSPGTVFGSFDSARVLGVNDSNVYLIAATIIEGGISKSALLKIQTDANGAQLSQTLVAKVGGPVGSGPATWSSLSTAPVSAAINNAGQVAFSGITSTGEQGVYVDSVAVARSNDPSAIPGQVWGNLLGAPVDINASGSVAIRGPWGDGVVDEVGDAGELYATAQQTTEGSLLRIAGTLSDEHDIDLYRIRISDYTAFSATTVPGPGFPGSSGDTVLYLFRDFGNANGITRTVLSRCDNVAPGVQQSTITSVNMPPDLGNGTGDYYVGIATPKVRTVSTSGREHFQEDPPSISIAGGKIYWTDLSEGKIVRADIATGAIDATYPVSILPAPYSGQNTGTGQLMSPPLTVVDSGPNRYVYWLSNAFADTRQRRADLNAPTFAIQDIRMTVNQPGEYIGMTGIVFDPTSSRIYWSRGDAGATDIRGALNFSNLDGSGGGTLVNSTAIGPRPRHLAVHNALRRIYFTETGARRIARVNIDGAAATVTAVATNVTATGIAVDAAANKVYWSVASTGIIERCNVDGTSRETFKSGLTANSLGFNAGAIAIDGGFLYAADPINRQIIRMSTASLQPATQVVVTLPATPGERTTDSFAHLDSLVAWTKLGTPSNPPIAYQIKLTGAVAYNEQAAIAVDGTKVVSTGDVVDGTGGAPIATLGSLTSPVRLSDNGLAAWRATWGTGSTLVTGLFLGTDKVADSNSPVTGSAGGIFRHVKDGPNGFDMSDSGQYIIASAIQRAVPFGEVPEYQINVVAFESVPGPTGTGCIGDFNQDGGVDGSDIESFFLQWEAGDSGADVNQDGGIDGGDIETFFV
ncbi:MAG: hypothetical protein NTV94_10015, partial [Planctomycetota bacterium]|nr:hypothetical protein [Planctomycetota bacterium]